MRAERPEVARPGVEDGEGRPGRTMAPRLVRNFRAGGQMQPAWVTPICRGLQALPDWKDMLQCGWCEMREP
jgi:hypothetical protein